MTSPLPRFTPSQVRQRVRLATAVGVLVFAAIASAGVASLASNRKPAIGGAAITPPAITPTTDLPSLLGPAALVEARIEAAEQATSKARSTIRRARQLGIVDETQLEALEQRLGVAGSISPSPSPVPPASRRIDAIVDPIDPLPRAL